VASLATAFGSGAMTNSIDELEHAEVIFVIGSNTSQQHPLIAMRIINAVKNNGAKLIVADPRKIPLAENAAIYAPLSPGSNLAFINGILNVIISENLMNKDFVENQTEGFEAFKASIEKYTPEEVSSITGVPSETIREIARLYAKARSEDFDEIHGFEIGADDYVKKPVKPSTLVARINALFRKQDKFKCEKNIFNYGGIEIDDSAHIVKVENEEIILSPKEYALLLILCENVGKVISREQLLSKVWGYEYFGGLRTVDTHINRLRVKLCKKGNLITTIRGYGYKLEG